MESEEGGGGTGISAVLNVEIAYKGSVRVIAAITRPTKFAI